MILIQSRLTPAATNLRGFSVFAAKVVLHGVVVAGKIESEQAAFGNENQPRFQIRAAFENVRRKFADADAGMMMGLSESRLHFQDGCQRVRLHPGDAPAETPGSFNRAGHLTFP